MLLIFVFVFFFDRSFEADRRLLMCVQIKSVVHVRAYIDSFVSGLRCCIWRSQLVSCISIPNSRARRDVMNVSSSVAHLVDDELMMMKRGGQWCVVAGI